MSIDTIQNASSLLYPTNTVLAIDTTVLLSTGTISIILIILILIVASVICIVVKYKQSVANRSSHSLKTSLETNLSHISNEMELLYMKVDELPDNPSFSNNENELLYMEVAHLQDNPSFSNDENELLYMEVTHLQDNPSFSYNENELLMEDNPVYGTNEQVDIISTIEPTENVAYVHVCNNTVDILNVEQNIDHDYI